MAIYLSLIDTPSHIIIQTMAASHLLDPEYLGWLRVSVALLQCQYVPLWQQQPEVSTHSVRWRQEERSTLTPYVRMLLTCPRCRYIYTYTSKHLWYKPSHHTPMLLRICSTILNRKKKGKLNSSSAQITMF